MDKHRPLQNSPQAADDTAQQPKALIPINLYRIYPSQNYIRLLETDL